VTALVRTYEAWNGVANKALRQHRLSPAGRQALAVLEGADRPLSPTTIAERLLVTTASMTSLLDTLEGRGFITRSPDPDDRRKVLVTLTENGRHVVDEFLPHVVALQTALMAGLTESQRRQLLESLAAIREATDILDADAVIAAAPPRGTPQRD
jgi:DNA-binding MarR family transcriptional regulator